LACANCDGTGWEREAIDTDWYGDAEKLLEAANECLAWYRRQKAERETEARLQAALERVTRDEIAACQRAVEAARWVDLRSN